VLRQEVLQECFASEDKDVFLDYLTVPWPESVAFVLALGANFEVWFKKVQYLQPILRRIFWLTLYATTGFSLTVDLQCTRQARALLSSCMP
jgi:hypothetical protein